MASSNPGEQPDHDEVWKTPSWQRGVRQALVKWFDIHQRALPWRLSRDPYKVWISEIMLQQTQVATVIPYFERFQHRFPDVAQLASADIEEVLRYWEGLGYYRRARQMHAAAVKIVEQHAGRFPESFKEVLALPGIGRYTAGAILSISQDQRLPVVEANTVRLYSRLIALRRPPAETASNRLLWNVAETLLPKTRSGRFNQAAMELGALICTPRDPKCDQCPLLRYCPTSRLGLQHEIPGKVKHVVYEDRNHLAVVIENEGHYFLRVCPPQTHWAGLWDFPRFDVTTCGSQAVEYARANFQSEFGWGIEVGESLATLRHGVTRYRITLNAYRGTVRKVGTGKRVADSMPYLGTTDSAATGVQQGWFTVDQLETLPLNTTGRKLVKLLSK